MRLFGSDPEFFAINSDETCIPPITLRRAGLNFYYEPEDIKCKHAIFYADDDVKIIEDGAAFEFNIKPTDNPVTFYSRIVKAKSILTDMLGKFNLLLHDKPVIKFDPQIMFIQGALDTAIAWACRFGCDEDYDVYKGTFSVEVDASKILKRFGGGHMHASPISFQFEDVFAMLCDTLVGNTFVKNSPYKTWELQRQEYYGRPGKIREQHYKDGITGIEYRTPSNSWLSCLTNVESMFIAMNKVFDVLPDNEKTDYILKNYLPQSIDNILSFNQDGAISTLEKINQVI